MQTKPIKKNYTAKEIVEIRGALFYSIIVVVLTIIASTLQVISGIALIEIAKTFFAYLFCALLALIIFKRKKNQKSTLHIIWFLAFVSNAMIIYTRYNYAKVYGWQYAIEGIHITSISLIFLVLLQYFYNKTLFLSFYVFHIINWFFFIYLAYKAGVKMPIISIVNGEPYHGILLTSEIFYHLIFVVIGMISYWNVPVIESFDRMTMRQKKKIHMQSEKQMDIARAVKENVLQLFTQVDEQNVELSNFNEKLQNQASAFEQISSTIEELMATSEHITNLANEDVDASAEMDFTMKQFFEIKEQTKGKLNSSLENIEVVVRQTKISNTILSDVEKTINELKDQSLKISDSISMIVEIADKINLLSLNASIEAARAGEHGRGFAVVADEIGKLAAMTGDSIKEIESVLTQSSLQTEAGTKIIKDASDNVKIMIDQMLQSSKKIDDLRDNIFLEEKFLKGIDDQMKKNVELSRATGTGTLEQKKALEMTGHSVEILNNDLMLMAENIAKIAVSSQFLCENAKLLTEQTEQNIGDDDNIEL
jgi:methyl-accepting chemotaxis protein